MHWTIPKAKFFDKADTKLLLPYNCQVEAQDFRNKKMINGQFYVYHTKQN